MAPPQQDMDSIEMITPTGTTTTISSPADGKMNDGDPDIERTTSIHTNADGKPRSKLQMFAIVTALFVRLNPPQYDHLYHNSFPPQSSIHTTTHHHPYQYLKPTIPPLAPSKSPHPNLI